MTNNRPRCRSEIVGTIRLEEVFSRMWKKYLLYRLQGYTIILEVLFPGLELSGPRRRIDILGGYLSMVHVDR